jgi:hypothetical protein
MPGFIPLFAIAVAALPSATTEASITVGECWLGEPYSFATATCRIPLENKDAQPIRVEAQAHGVEISPASIVIPARGKAELTARVDVGNASGRLEYGVRLHPERGPDSIARLRGFAMSALDDPRPMVDFGVVDASARKDERTIALASHDTSAFRITGIEHVPDGVSATLADDHRSLKISLRPDASWGIVDDDIKLTIDTPHQHEAWVHVTADVHGDISIENNPFWFGSLPAGSKRTFLIPMTSRGGREFRVGKVDGAMADAAVDTVPCDNKAVYCKAVRVVFADSQPAGLTRGKLDVELPDSGRHLHIRYWGLLQNDAAANASTSPMPMPPQEDISAPWTEGVVDSVNAPVYALPGEDPLDKAEPGPPPSKDPPVGAGPLLKWNVADESGAYGYQVFRGDSADGPFVLQNERLIRVHPKDYRDIPYFWRDATASPGDAYWYYVGVVYKDGRKQALSPPHRKVAENK